MDRDRSDRVVPSRSGLAIDHVLLATTGLNAGSRALHELYGLDSLEGGRHPDWGTANRIVPVGTAYLELVAVVDENVAARNPFGRWVASASARLIQPLGWAVRTASIEAVATRHDLRVDAGSRETANGRILRWRVAGVAQAMAEPMLPFFIEWGPGTPHPSEASGAETGPTFEIARLELEGDAERLQNWLGGARLSVTVSPGPPRLAKVVVSTPNGDLSIAATPH